MTKLYLAMSCLQGRPQAEAYQELSALEPDGIQLTPGNKISANFREQITLPVKFHHTFEWDQYRGQAYDEELNPLYQESERSVHPPKSGNFYSWIEKMQGHLVEVMYPSYLLGCGSELEHAMSLRQRLAIDISHLFIMKTQNCISDITISKLLNYDYIEEVHISQNAGTYDSHRPIHSQSYLLDWAKSRNCTLIYESYLHKLSQGERLSQLELIRK